jgi:hypothetical protein
MEQLTKAHNHAYFFSHNGVIHEAYKTIRGLRHRPLIAIEYPDKAILCDVDVLLINSELKNKD